MAFDETRFRRGVFKIFENGIKPLDVSNLQHAIFLLRELDEFARLGAAIRHRLFNEYVFALGEQWFGNFKMRCRGRGDVQRIGILRGLGNGTENLRAMFSPDPVRGIGVGVADPGELDLPGLFQFRIDARMVLAERADAQDGDADFA